VTGTGQLDVSAPPADPGPRAARGLIRRAQSFSAAVAALLQAPQARRAEAQQAYRPLQAEAAREQLDQMPLDRLKDVTRGRLMLGTLEEAGFRTVGSVLAAGETGLDSVPGVGPQTAAQVTAAARQLEAALASTATARIDPDRRTVPQTRLLAALHAYERAQAELPPNAPDPAPVKAELDAALGDARPAGSRLRMFFAGPGGRQRARDGLGRLTAVLGSSQAAELNARLRSGTPAEPAPDPAALWDDFLARPVAYNGLLIDVAGLAPDEESAQGFLPADIAERVNRQPLDLVLVSASLRGYQAFGAKFALAQRRVIIGDEMGLGKTVQALAAMAHLAAVRAASAADDGPGAEAGAERRNAGRGPAWGRGRARAAAAGPALFLVVCPASVLINWTREIASHTKLPAHRLHGDDREAARQAWLTEGGVGVTTYEALRAMPVPEGIELSMLTVDEAHYAKNPRTLRTKAVRGWARATPRVLFLTGTPMENRVEEFRSLVDHLRPDIAESVSDVDGALGGARFRRAVAAVYLRRNQDDVLGELPPRLETSDWVPLDGAALAVYKDAVAEGNMMKMRRAAFTTERAEDGTLDYPKKLDRLVDIVEEATEDGRKVIVFSFFRSVLGTVMTALGDKAVGPLTGDVPPPDRQALIDEFTRRSGPSVLVSQIQAGGVGLNIQAASVVVICEPQWNPAIEEQAVARAHRLGQLRRVDVHRLLAEDTVDQRMLELTSAKRAEFDEYARRSDLAAATPDAIDISDLSAVAEVASQAEAERRILAAERERLGLAPRGRTS
jgi:superfamily II DNA or RNA helicase